MYLATYKRGSSSVTLRVKLFSSAALRAGLTGLSSSSAGLIISTIGSTEATAVTYTQAGSTIESITTNGIYAAPTATKCRFKEIDATNHPGYYELQLANARFAVPFQTLVISIHGAANLEQQDLYVRLALLDPDDGIRAGLTALPGTAAEAVGGLFVRGTGAGQINQSANGQIDVKLVTITAGIIAAASFAANALDAMWSTAGRTLTANTNLLTAAQVNAEMVDVLSTDTYAEPAQSAPGATISLASKIGYLYKAFRNRSTQTVVAYKLYNAAGTTIDHKSTCSTDGTTWDSGLKVSGP